MRAAVPTAPPPAPRTPLHTCVCPPQCEVLRSVSLTPRQATRLVGLVASLPCVPVATLLGLLEEREWDKLVGAGPWLE